MFQHVVTLRKLSSYVHSGRNGTTS